jgi:uncharacterized zinc-type alcohol dehydrogenase-like protein
LRLHHRAPQPTATDVQIQILYCGVCHSDLHFARNEWGFTQYPAVPGHEIVGRVTAVGSGVKKFKVGDTVGVGCLVDSCRTCPDCRAGLEQFCDQHGDDLRQHGQASSAARRSAATRRASS